MKLQVNNLNYNLNELARRLGYIPQRLTSEGELSAVRSFGGDYPRFHLYIKESPKIISLNLHLDQKKSSYEGTAAHGGDYEGETVRDELARIKDVIFSF